MLHEIIMQRMEVMIRYTDDEGQAIFESNMSFGMLDKVADALSLLKAYRPQQSFFLDQVL